MPTLPSTLVCLRDSRLAVPLWTVLAVASVAFGITMALQPDRSSDLGVVREWMHHWFVSGASIYPIERLEVDYPPYALVLLAPLAWLPEDTAIPIFLVFNVVTTVVMAWVMATWMADETGVGRDRRDRLAFTMMVLSWGAIRIALWNAQTVALAVAAGMLAVRLAPRYPHWAGLALMVAACKPTLGLAFGLILLLREHVRTVIAGAVIALSLTTVYGISVHQAPWTSLIEYLHSLFAMYGDGDFVRGVTTIRPLLHDLSNGHPASAAIFQLFAAGTFVAMAVCVWPMRRHPHAQALIVSACLLWTMLALPNQRYYLLLMAPAVWVLVWTPHRVAAPAARWPAWLALLIIVFNVADTPLSMRLFVEWVSDSAPVFTHGLLELMWVGAYVVAAPIILLTYALVLRALRRMAQP